MRAILAWQAHRRERRGWIHLDERIWCWMRFAKYYRHKNNTGRSCATVAQAFLLCGFEIDNFHSLKPFHIILPQVHQLADGNVRAAQTRRTHGQQKYAHEKITSNPRQSRLQTAV